MRKLALAALAVALSASTAPAADLDVHPYQAPMVAPGWDWSGFYVGGNAGYASGRSCFDLVTGAGTFIGAEGCQSATGAIAGGQVGYRTQSYGLVYGLEAQGDWTSLRGSRVSSAFFFAAPGDLANRTRIDALGLFTGQIGYAWGRTLLYVKGGAAVVTGRDNDVFVGSGVVGVTAPDTRVGGTVGGGIEFGFAPNLSFGVEYDHLFMGTQTLSFSNIGNIAGLPLPTDRIRQDIDLVSVRINYVFGGPSIAKY